MIATITKCWAFDTAETDESLVTVGATDRMVVTYAQATCSNSNTGDVSLRLGFGTTTLATLTINVATGALGEIMSHPGIAKGGGMVVANGGAPIASGAAGEDLRLTCSAATGGAVRLVVSYWIDSLVE